MAEEMDVFLFSEGKKTHRFLMKAMKQRIWKMKTLQEPGSAVKLSRLDGKTSVSEGNGTGPAVNGNSIGSSSKKPTGKTDYNRSTGQNARGCRLKKHGDGWKRY